MIPGKIIPKEGSPILWDVCIRIKLIIVFLFLFPFVGKIRKDHSCEGSGIGNGHSNNNSKSLAHFSASHFWISSSFIR